MHTVSNGQVFAGFVKGKPRKVALFGRYVHLFSVQ